MNTHFRPRPIDIAVPLQIVTDRDLIEEIEKELQQHSFTPIKSKKKRKGDEEEEIEEPVVDEETNKVPTPGFWLVEEPKLSKATAKKTEKFKLEKDNYIKFKGKSDEDLQEIVEYDVDSEDDDFLDALYGRDKSKKKKNNNPGEVISEDQFEAIIDLFEKRAVQKKDTVDEMELFQTTNFGNEFEICCICGDTAEQADDNHMLYCETCHILVHQYCYGVTKMPPEDQGWKCRKCEAGISKPKCVFCPVEGGAFKQTTDGRWAHVVCALWIPELSFKNKEAMEPISQISKIPKDRWNLQCTLCNDRHGVCVECSDPDCSQVFHVLCARERGYVVETKPTPTKDLRFLAYCRAHSLQKEVEANPRTFGSKPLPPNLQAKLVSVVTKAGRGTKTVPPDVIEAIYYYWKQKRRFHAYSLLRRFQYLEKGPRFTRHNISDQEYYARFLKLRRDFEKVRLLIDLVRKREHLKRDNSFVISDLILQALQAKDKQWDREAELERAMLEQSESSSSESEEVIVDDESEGESSESENKKNEEPAPTPQKRRRGRPPKNSPVVERKSPKPKDEKKSPKMGKKKVTTYDKASSKKEKEPEKQQKTKEKKEKSKEKYQESDQEEEEEEEQQQQQQQQSPKKLKVNHITSSPPTKSPGKKQVIPKSSPSPNKKTTKLNGHLTPNSKEKSKLNGSAVKNKYRRKS